jgi:YD repeat-containing protein
MKKTIHSLLIAAALLAPVAATAQSGFTNAYATNHLTLSARMGFNISAKFKGVTPAPSALPSISRLAPDGLAYNYDNGYVHTDVSDNFGGQTWNWGYDAASQISGDTILMNRSTPVGRSSSPSMENNPYPGAEIAYSRLLGGVKEDGYYGFEVAANYMSVPLNQTVSGKVSRLTDAYPFTPGTTPPAAPYQGSFNGPGFVIGDSPVSSTTTILPGAGLRDKQQYDGNLWGLRLGPYLDIPLSERWDISFSGGLAVGLLNSSASWKQTVAGVTVASGSGSDWDVLWGFYIGANVSYLISERWSAVGGAQFQYLGTYEHSFGGRKVEVDFGQTIFVTLGLAYSF